MFNVCIQLKKTIRRKAYKATSNSEAFSKTLQMFNVCIQLKKTIRRKAYKATSNSEAFSKTLQMFNVCIQLKKTIRRKAYKATSNSEAFSKTLQMFNVCIQLKKTIRRKAKPNQSKTGLVVLKEVINYCRSSAAPTRHSISLMNLRHQFRRPRSCLKRCLACSKTASFYGTIYDIIVANYQV